jgi:hypothetical protein
MLWYFIAFTLGAAIGSALTIALLLLSTPLVDRHTDDETH